jgi:hypothetical protein
MIKIGMFLKSPLASTSYTQFQKIDEITLNKNGIKYSDQLKKEQKTLKSLINTMFPTTINENMVTLMKVTENFRHHTEDDFKFVNFKSAEYQKLTSKDNFVLIGSVKEMKDFFNSITI